MDPRPRLSSLPLLKFILQSRWFEKCYKIDSAPFLAWSLGDRGRGLESCAALCWSECAVMARQVFTEWLVPHLTLPTPALALNIFYHSKNIFGRAVIFFYILISNIKRINEQRSGRILNTGHISYDCASISSTPLWLPLCRHDWSRWMGIWQSTTCRDESFSNIYFWNVSNYSISECGWIWWGDPPLITWLQHLSISIVRLNWHHDNICPTALAQPESFQFWHRWHILFTLSASKDLLLESTSLNA